MNALAEMWGSLAEIAAITLQAAEQTAQDLQSQPSASRAEVARMNAIAAQAGELLEKATSEMLAEI
jgi:hypothetical protein